jgi:mersacidin/lichenicidin family type 2 lantibiotic
MSKLDIIRAWKDEDYRASLSDAERAMLPPHPAGLIELTDTDLDRAAGAKEESAATRPVLSFGCCDHTLTVGTCRVATLGCCSAA